MNEAQLHDALSELPEELLVPVDALRARKHVPWVKWVSMAACLALVIGFSAWLLPGFFGSVAMDNAGEAAPEYLYGGVDDGIMEPNYSVQGSATGTLHSFRATVLEVHDTYLLVTPEEGYAAADSSSRIEVYPAKQAQLPAAAPGDKVEIFYDGTLQETYPARIPSAYKIEILE